MTVSEALNVLSKIERRGGGDLPLIAMDTSSGRSYDLSIDENIAQKGDSDNIGTLCNYLNGSVYTRAFLD